MKRSLTVLLALAAAIAGLTGCNDGKVKEANAYVRAVNKAQDEFAAKNSELIGEISGASRKHDAATLRQFQAAVDRLLGRLRAITPPAKVKALHAKLTAAVVRLGGGLRAATADVTSGNVGRILDGQAAFKVAVRDFTHTTNATLAEINSTLKS